MSQAYHEAMSLLKRLEEELQRGTRNLKETIDPVASLLEEQRRDTQQPSLTEEYQMREQANPRAYRGRAYIRLV